MISYWAAILNIKIKYISKWINNRQKIANNYLNLLEKNPFISFPKISSDSISHSWNQFVIKLKNDKYFLNEDFSNLFDTDCKKYYSLRNCLLYTSPSPRDATLSRMPSSA